MYNYFREYNYSNLKIIIFKSLSKNDLKTNKKGLILHKKKIIFTASLLRRRLMSLPNLLHLSE